MKFKKGICGMGVLWFLVVMLSLLIGAGVNAQAPGACADEIAQFCQGVQNGGGQITKCLAEHSNELSDWCKSSITGAKQEAEQACHDDVMLLCGGAGSGGGKVAQCLRDKESWLSVECKIKLGMIQTN